MSARVVCRTRRRGEGRCRACKQPIRVGEQYRELVAVRCDAFNEPFVRETIHESCIFGAEARAWWEPRNWPIRRLARKGSRPSDG